MSIGETILEQQLRDAGIFYEREYRFAPPRRWRADFRVGYRLLVEVEGGVWTQGRHTRGAGYLADLEKYNAAAMAGWVVMRFSTDMVRSGHALDQIERFLE